MIAIANARRRNAVTPGTFAAHTQMFSGGGSSISGTVTVPSGAGHLRIRLDGAGSGAARAASPAAYGGNGGAYCEHYVAIVSGDYGATISYTLGALGRGRTSTAGSGSASSASSVTGTITAGAIALAVTGAGGGTTTAAGSQSTASGGNVSNTSGGTATDYDGGNPGSDGTSRASAGQPGGVAGGGGPGVLDGYLQLDGGDGGPARVSFEWTL